MTFFLREKDFSDFSPFS